MTADAEVHSEVAGVEEKSEFMARSFQDLGKPELNCIGNHDQAHDPEDSYVLVTDVGGPSADGEDTAAVDASPRHGSSAPVELLGVELDARNGSPEGVMEGGDESFTLVNDSTGVQLISSVEAGGDQDTVEQDKCLEEFSGQNGKIIVVNGEADPEGDKHLEESSDQNERISVVNGEGDPTLTEGDKFLEDSSDQNGRISVVNGEADPTLTEEDKCLEEMSDQNGKISFENGEVNPTLTEGDTLEESADQNERINVVNGEADPTLTEGDKCLEELCDQNGEVSVVNGEADPTLTEGDTCFEELTDQNGKINFVNGEADPTLTKGDTFLEELTDQNGKINFVNAEGDPGSMEGDKCLEELIDQNEKINVVNSEADPTLTEGVIRNAASTDENPSAGNEILVGVEGSVWDDDEIQGKLAVSEPECVAESEIKKAEDSNVNVERSEEAEEVKFGDQNREFGVVAEAEPDKIKDQLISEVNQESKVPNLEMVADSGEVEEPKIFLLSSDKQETVEYEVESSLSQEAMQDQNLDIDPDNNFQHSLDKDKVLDSNAVCDVGAACEEVSEVEGSIMHPDDAVNSQDGNGATPQICVSEREAGASGDTRKISPSSYQVHRPANEVQISDAYTAGVESSLPSDGSDGPVHPDSSETCSIDGACSGSDIRTVVSNEMEPISQGSELSADSENDRNPPVLAVKLELEADNSSASDHVTLTSEKDATSELEVIDSFVSDKDVSNSMLQSADVKTMVGGFSGNDDETFLLAENADTGNSCSTDISMASGQSGADTVTEKDVSVVAVTKPFIFFVRTPRYSDEKLEEQIRIAELELNEKTKLRDSIQAQIQEKRAKNQNNGIEYEYAKGEDRGVKKLLKEKRMEIDSLQSVINKAKNAISIEDLNSQIKTIEHMIQHETLPLKEEKHFINEIKHLKQLREQLSSSKCSQTEIQQALEQREQAEERLKTLRKELGSLKDMASRAQTACDEAEGKYNIEHQKVKELQAQFRAADDVRQEAYAKFLSLSKELSQKRKNFFKFKNDSATATYYAFTDDKKTLHHHCMNEVENFMKLWNGNDEFRSEYVRLNTRSTLRRFGTSDGRSLGPDEKPPILPSYVRERNVKVVSVPAKADLVSRSPPVELKPETNIENVSSGIHLNKKETERKEKTVTTRGPAKSKQVKSLATVSGVDEEELEVQGEPIKTEEELELIRKAEETKREETEAQLKEQRRLEEIVKAQEARERKQRREEKAQRREELKARKEAEQKEKEREKKSRKKERRRVATSSTSASTDVQDDAGSITCDEISKEEASTQVNDVSTKKPKTSCVMVSKLSKTRSMPPPALRNRNRRKWQQWMWVSVISLVVLVLFWLGNMGVCVL